MNTGFNFLSFVGLSDFMARQTGQKPPAKPQPKPLAPPINSPLVSPEMPSNTNYFDRSFSIIRENTWATAIAFAAVNFLLVKLADKVNEISTPHLTKFVQIPAYQNIARYGLTAGIVFVGNYTFSKLLQSSASPLHLVAISTATTSIKLLFEYGPTFWKNRADFFSSKNV